MRKLTRAFAPIVFVLSLLLSGCAPVSYTHLTLPTN